MKIMPCDFSTLEGKLAVYVFGLCGCLRIVAGIYSTERGAVMGGILSMIFEIALTAQIAVDKYGTVLHADVNAAYVLCGLTLLYLLANLPSPAPKSKSD